MWKRRIGLLAVMLLAAAPALAQGVIDLPQTGQTTCYDAAGSVIACAGTGQDGDIQAGVAWPSPRFTVSGDCVTDNLTGLMWVKSPDSTTRTWADALTYADGLSLCGYSDWRLPNVNELESLVHAGQANTATWLNSLGFTNVQSGGYWSSSTYADGTDGAWVVYMVGGGVGADSKASNGFVWPVRGTTTTPAELWKTGQTTSYATGDDGDLERGVAWPSPRFTDNGDGTVTDNLTGLIWLQNANCFGTRTWANALTDANTLNSGECGLSDGSAEGDWRLPNRKELRSLIDYSQYDLALPSGHPFNNVQSTYYWSSSTYARSTYTYNAWVVDLRDGSVYAGNKTGCCDVWPVRAGGLLGNSDLSVTKTDSPDPVTVGNNLTYTVTITNNGPGGATGVVLTDTLPVGVTFVSATPSQGSCGEASGVVTCKEL